MHYTRTRTNIFGNVTRQDINMIIPARDYIQNAHKYYLEFGAFFF